MDNASYSEKLVGSLSSIAGHSDYPGKEGVVEQCLEEVEEIRLSGRITAEQSVTLRELLLGDEPSGTPEDALRVRSPWSGTAMPIRVAIACQGEGSHAAFSAGALRGLLEHDGDYGEIAALGGTAYGSICALLAWSGLLRGDPRGAVDKLRAFWLDYAATGPIDTLLNGSAQMALRLRALVAFAGLGPYNDCFWSRERLRSILERRMDFDEARALARNEDVPGLVIGGVDGTGATVTLHGPQVSADRILAATIIPRPFKAFAREGRHPGEGLIHLTPPIRELVDFGPDEIWVIQVLRSTRKGPSRTAGDTPDPYEWAGRLLLEQELRFIRTINDLIDRGVLIGGGYRHIEVHRIVLEHDLDDASMLDRSPDFIGHLMAQGRERAERFLDERRCRLSGPSPTRSMR